MKAKKIIALLTLMLFVLLLVPMISNTANSNNWTPIIPQQVNTQPKAIPTDNMSKYIAIGQNLTYDSISTIF
nr:hypothetical protein [Candidatus Freyarchaeota archaeon]